MNIRDINQNLQKLYQEMEETFSGFQSSTGLSCLTGCGRCCLNPDIEATVLEMIPVALKIYDEGKILEWLERVQTDEQKICLFYIPRDQVGLGLCGSYGERPSVCRMFGVAGTFDKHRNKTLSICKYIREDKPSQTLEVIKNVPSETPMIPEWTQKLTAIAPDLTRERFPLNLALKKALEKIALLSQYESVL